MKRHIIFLFTAICGILLLALPVSAERQFEDCIANCKLYDPNGLFDASEAEQLNQLIRETSDNTNMYIAVQVINSSENLSDYETEVLADDRYDELFNPQKGVDTDGVMLVLNMPTHYIYITTSGLGELYYYNARENDRVGQMVENMKSYLRSSDNVGAVRRFCQDAVNYYQAGIPNHAYTYNKDTHQYTYTKKGEIVRSEHLPFSYLHPINYGVGLIAGVICAALTALISYAVIKSRYKFTKTLSASSYISDKETTFYQRDDMFIRTHTTKTRIDTDRGSGGGGFSGGGSSHSSSGGHSHGGGGGHW